MKLYDTSQEVFSCAVYPGDDAPERIAELRMSDGGAYNLTSLRMNAHNGTHIDAPFHCCREGKTVDQLALEKCVGPCYVAEYTGQAEAVLAAAGGVGRILLKGQTDVTAEAAAVFAKAGIDLLGVESQSVGPISAPLPVHLPLLRAEVVLLEGLRLQDVAPGRYFLSAAPLNLGGSDGAPCRAVLIEA